MEYDLQLFYCKDGYDKCMILSDINVVSELFVKYAYKQNCILRRYRICFLFPENRNLYDLFKGFISRTLTA